MTERIIIAGFGGQGVILAGKLLAYTGMIEGKYVSHIPSYGAEMRGGTANCSVIISDREISSPLISKPTTIIVMNPPSLFKFEENVLSNGKVFVNSSLIDDKVKRDDVDIYYVPANDIAEKAGSGRASNMVMVGAFIGVTEIVEKENVKNSLSNVISKRNLKFNEINFKAIDMGYDFVKKELWS
ncbi:MAG: 2-oxoacid:acceptor oxidoreductase family protein [Spirochaetaceae bacterium]|nr:2-oxoacid:acceptor oxidoreductase family protein [Spirochaetaceae bacterium]